MKQLFTLTLFLAFSSHFSYAQFAKGADVGWLSQMEASGRKFYDQSGKQQDLLAILQSKGINAIRLRVWYNPQNGWCGKEDVVKQALRAQNLGFRILIDFHYSDSWADPGQQNKPNAWANYSFSQLTKGVYDHTFEVLTALKAKGVTPEWVQVGNETNNGMLWPDGQASTQMKNFAQLVTSGYNAVKAVSSQTKVIVHLSNGYDNGLFRWMFDGLKNNGAQWDVIGMSLYPEANNWSTLTTQCLANMNDMVTRYSKEVVVAEIGMGWSEAQACRDFIADILKKTRSVNNQKGIGVFYWEPQCYNGWNGYQKGAFDNSGKPTVAMDAFLEGGVTGLPFENKTVHTTISPNPFYQYTTLEAEGDFTFTVTDALGMTVAQGEAKNSITIGKELSKGVHLVQLRTANAIQFMKIVKE